MIGEVYDVDSKMLNKLDELEEHPGFYERDMANVIVAPEAKLKGSENFEGVSVFCRISCSLVVKILCSV